MRCSVDQGTLICKKMERFLSYIRRIVPLCYFLKWILSVTTLMSFSPWGWMLKDTTI